MNSIKTDHTTQTRLCFSITDPPCLCAVEEYGGASPLLWKVSKHFRNLTQKKKIFFDVKWKNNKSQCCIWSAENVCQSIQLILFRGSFILQHGDTEGSSLSAREGGTQRSQGALEPVLCPGWVSGIYSRKGVWSFQWLEEKFGKKEKQQWRWRGEGRIAWIRWCFPHTNDPLGSGGPAHSSLTFIWSKTDESLKLFLAREPECSKHFKSYTTIA